MESITAILATKKPRFNKISSEASIRDALVRMGCHDTEYLIVVDDNDNFLGLLTEHEIISASLITDRSIESITVRQVMNTRLPAASSTDSIEDCMRLMKQFNVRYLPVFNELQFAGIISAEDILHHAVIYRNEIFDKEEKSFSAEYSY